MLTIASSKEVGIIGKAELDLSSYGHDSFNELKLPLKECKYENAFIQIGLKGVESKVLTQPTTPTADSGVNNDSMLTLM